MDTQDLTGRPSLYSLELAEKICDLIAGGDSLRQIEKLPEMPAKRTILRWLAKHEEFRKLYATAHEIQSEAEMDELIAIADDDTADIQFKEIETEHGKEAKAVFVRASVERAKLRINVRQWRIEKRYPSKYGNRQTVEVAYPEPTVIKGPDGKIIEVLGAGK